MPLESILSNRVTGTLICSFFLACTHFLVCVTPYVKRCVSNVAINDFPLTLYFFYLRAGGEDSAFSNSSIILQLREQVSQLQGILQEKEESEKTAAQKLAMYQNQLHAKNNEVSTLKDQLQAQVC